MKRWNKEDMNFLQEHYLDMTHEQIATALKRTKTSVKNKCKNSRLLSKIYQHKVNDTYFDNWSNNVAYILGFLTSDGNLAKNRTQIEIYLHSKDIEILKFIQSEICPNNSIKEKIDNRSGTKFVQLRFSSKQIYNRLIELGVTPQKTGKETYPVELPSEFKFDYLRGLFDGDGCIYYRPKSEDKSKQNDWYICSSNKEFLINLKENILPHVGYIYSQVSRNMYYWNVGKTSDIRSLASLMYVGSNFSLKRKRDKMMSV